MQPWQRSRIKLRHWIRDDPECKRGRQVRGRLGFRDRATERRRLRRRHGSASLVKRDESIREESRGLSFSSRNTEWKRVEGRRKEERISVRGAWKRERGERERERDWGRIRTCQVTHCNSSAIGGRQLTGEVWMSISRLHPRHGRRVYLVERVTSIAVSFPFFPSSFPFSPFLSLLVLFLSNRWIDGFRT